MEAEVSRDNLSNLVEQFLNSGGQVQELKPMQPSTQKASEKQKRLGISRVKRDPLEKAITLGERERLPDVESCIERGLTFTEIIKELGIRRGSLSRIISEYQLVVAKPESTSTKKRLTDQQVIDNILAQLPSGKSLSAICVGLGVKNSRGMDLYLAYRAKNPDCPKLNERRGRKSHMSDEQILTMLIAGMESGQTLLRLCRGAGISPIRGQQIYDDYKDRLRYTKKG